MSQKKSEQQRAAEAVIDHKATIAGRIAYFEMAVKTRAEIGHHDPEQTDSDLKEILKLKGQLAEAPHELHEKHNAACK